MMPYRVERTVGGYPIFSETDLFMPPVRGNNVQLRQGAEKKEIEMYEEYLEIIEGG